MVWDVWNVWRALIIWRPCSEWCICILAAVLSVLRLLGTLSLRLDRSWVAWPTARDTRGRRFFDARGRRFIDPDPHGIGAAESLTREAMLPSEADLLFF